MYGRRVSRGGGRQRQQQQQRGQLPTVLAYRPTYLVPTHGHTGRTPKQEPWTLEPGSGFYNNQVHSQCLAHSSICTHSGSLATHTHTHHSHPHCHSHSHSILKTGQRSSDMGNAYITISRCMSPDALLHAGAKTHGCTSGGAGVPKLPACLPACLPTSSRLTSLPVCGLPSCLRA